MLPACRNAPLVCALFVAVSLAREDVVPPAPLLARRLPAVATNPLFGNQGTVLQVFDGITQAFFHTTESHSSCFVAHGADLETQLQSAVVNVVFTIGQLFQGHSDQIGNNLGELMIAVDRILDGWSQLVHTCLSADLLATVHSVGDHLQNMSYIGRHLRANGMDVVHQLSDAILDFHDHHFMEFGRDLGLAFRRVLLSNCTSVPEGGPTSDVMGEMSGGLIQGFFGPGVTFQIVQGNGQQLTLDLHQCVAENQLFFQTTWALAWRFFAQLAAGGWGEVQNHTDQWTGNLAIVLLQLPQALHKCGMTAAQQGMLRHAMSQLNNTLNNGTHVVFTDGIGFRADSVGVQMTQAVQSWSELHWEAFGEHLGKLLQELVLLLFPQEYSVDAGGELHRQLEGLEAAGGHAGLEAPGRAHGGSPHDSNPAFADSIAGSFASLLIALFAMVSLTVLLVAVRSRKSLNMWGVTNRGSNGPNDDALE